LMSFHKNKRLPELKELRSMGKQFKNSRRRAENCRSRAGLSTNYGHNIQMERAKIIKNVLNTNRQLSRYRRLRF